MNTDKVREEFERLIRSSIIADGHSQEHADCLLLRDDDGLYSLYHLEYKWQGFQMGQAARAGGDGEAVGFLDNENLHQLKAGKPAKIYAVGNKPWGGQHFVYLHPPPPAAKVPDRGWLKEFCTSFFYWWANQPGTNTQQGFDCWTETKGAADLLNRLAAPQPAEQDKP